MKICQVKLKNIHSLKGEHTIDFTNGPLGEAGLFVITGPTGAGKSTILDVITLALFNRIPRISSSISKKVIEEEGVVLTKNTDDCYAEVEYLVNENLYRSSWSIKKTRNNTLTERLHILTDVTNNNTIISSSISQVPKENEGIIGLNYEQFVQSMILAQGQFSKLLLAKRDERNQLLEDITGTSIYRTIGRTAFLKFKSAEKAVSDQKIRMETVLLTNEEIEEIQVQISSKTPILNSQQALKGELEEKKNIKQLIQLNLKKQQDLKVDWDLLLIEKDQFNAVLILLEEHTKYVVFKDQLIKIRQLEKEISDASKELVELTEFDQKLQNEQVDFILKTGVFISSVISKDSYFSQIENFRVEVQKLVDLEKEKSQQVSAEKRVFQDKITQLNNNGFSLIENDEFQLQVEQELEQIELQSNKLSINSIENIRLNQDQLLRLKIPATSLIGNRKLFNEQQKSIELLSNKVTQQSDLLKENTIDFVKLSNELTDLEPKLEEAILKLNESNKVKSLEAYRIDLKEDCPCPLCGAIDHPYLKNHQEVLIDVLQSQVDLLKKQFEEKKNEKLKVEVNNQNLTRSIETDSLELTQKTNDFKVVEIQIDQLCQELNWNKQQSLEEWMVLSDSIDEEIKQLSNLERKLACQVTLKELILLKSEIDKLTFELSEIQTKRVEKYSGVDINLDTNKLIEKWNSYQTKITITKESLEKNTNHLEVLKQNQESISEKLLSEIKIQGLNEIEELESKILEEGIANQYRERLKALSEKEVALKTNSELVEKELNEALLKNDESITLDELVIQIQSLSDSVEIIKKEIWELNKQLEIDQENRVKQQANQLILDRLNKDLALWSKMNLLIGDAQGKKFSNFVQDLTLKQLIEFGNKRLIAFSDRYLMEVDGESDALKVIDTYMGSTQRAVTSLSGGETFKLSLALAFGLSDLAAKNINIESLFIDEGFGTLDPESLDQAITILEHMQNTSNKSIGIISHVGELKERIGTKIKLNRTSAGYSSIEIEA